MSVTDKGARAIPRSDIRDRLVAAALELFQRDGYEETTAAQIAAQTGVTERTFFRHFADKREILFGAEDMVREAIVAGIRAAPEGGSPLGTLFDAYEAFRPVIEERRGYAKPRQALIVATPVLRERELAKIASLSEAIAAALKDRGIPSRHADLAAHIGMAAIAQATAEWLDDDRVDLAERFRLAREALRELL